MSLTEEATREREWGRFPVLRRILERERVPDHYCTSSVSDSIFDALVRLMKHSILVQEHEEEIRNAANSTNIEQLFGELRALEEALKDASRNFDRARDRLAGLRKSL